MRVIIVFSTSERILYHFYLVEIDYLSGQLKEDSFSGFCRSKLQSTVPNSIHQPVHRSVRKVGIQVFFVNSLT